MSLRYRIISIDEAEFSFVVRFFSDELSEFDLRLDPADQTDPPLRCRTDYNISVMQDGISEDDLHKLILQSAPTDWLQRKGQVKTAPPTMAAAHALKGQTFAVKVVGNAEIDITHELQT